MANRITFRFKSDQICIWRKTVQSLGMPNYIHLLIKEKEKQMFIQVCERDRNAFRLYYTKDKNGIKKEFHIKAKRLLKYLANVVGVDYEGSTIRFEGVLMEDGQTVFIDLCKYVALDSNDEINEDEEIDSI